MCSFAHAGGEAQARYFIHLHVRLNRLMAEAGFANPHHGGPREGRVVLYRALLTGPLVRQPYDGRNGWNPTSCVPEAPASRPRPIN